MISPFVRSVALFVCVGASLCWCAPAGALTVQFDYTHDGGFFSNVQVNPQADAARAALEHAAKSLEMYLDHLARIEPYGQNTWEAIYTSPDTGEEAIEPNLVVPADTVIVYAGARPLANGKLGQGGPGGHSVTYVDIEWYDTVQFRGQEGAAAVEPTDFGPWGGSIAFNSTEDWHFGIDDPPPPGSGLNDFLSTATHELCHLLGFGTAESWHELVLTGSHEFEGAAAVATFGGDVPLDVIHAHWAPGTQSTVAGAAQEAAMDPDLTVEHRKRLTVLDRAGLEDIGWDMPLPGDANHDGDVDFLDYIQLKSHVGQTGSWMEGDFDFDGDIDAADFVELRAHFGQSVYEPAGPTGGVSLAPEPGTWVLLALGFALAGRRRRRPGR